MQCDWDIRRGDSRIEVFIAPSDEGAVCVAD